MILQSGVEFGDYEILGLVGEGAMGKVYRARDRTLGRDVALKVLSPEISRQEEHLARFQREARVLASLSHPNVAVIHGVGKASGTSFIILELIEGDTLAEVLAQGRLPIRRTLELSLQIADALEAAHARGIVHRDLKPANVKVTEGKVKVLDFGIAKCFSDESRESSAKVSAAPDDLSTETGVVLGTIGYMSPEQIRGASVDGRSDVWAFGCVLFELLTHKRAFRGKTPTDTLVQVLDGEPDWKALPPEVPPAIDRLVRRCLQKDRNRRLQAIGDARIEIEDALAGHAPSRDRFESSGRSSLIRLVLAALLAGAAGGFFVSRAVSPIAGNAFRAAGRGVTRFRFAVGEGESLPYSGQRSLALSPDGSRLAYVVQEPDGSTRVYQRPLDRLESSIVPDTNGAREPFFSPDSKWLGFFTASGDAHRLQRLSFEGGVPVVFHEEPRPPRGGIGWSQGDEILFAAADGLRVISSNGGAPRVVACGEASLAKEVCRWPEILPGGKAIVYTVSTAGDHPGEPRLVAASILTGEERTLVEGGFGARFSRTGHLVYAQRGGLFAAPFDVEKLKFTMQPSRIASDVLIDPETSAAQFAISSDGTLAFVAGAPPEPGRRFFSLDEGGTRFWTSTERFPLGGTFRLSPDGRTIALVLEERGAANVWLYDLQTHALRRFTDGISDDSPVWSPDGRRLVFRSQSSGRRRLYSKEIQGGTVTPLMDRDDLIEPATWGQSYIAFTVRTKDGGLDIWSLGTEVLEAEPLLTSTANETEPAYSRGRLAYVSDATGSEEVYVIRSDVEGDPVRVSAAGGRTPRWSGDGRTLFYRRGEDLLSVAVGTEDKIVAGSPSVVWSMAVDAPYEVLPGGGFLVAEKPAAPHEIVVVSNFPAELESH